MDGRERRFNRRLRANPPQPASAATGVGAPVRRASHQSRPSAGAAASVVTTKNETQSMLLGEDAAPEASTVRAWAMNEVRSAYWVAV